ncbi:MAG: hypothetical protein A2073_04725 [Deltaproteobacteria bacterium GWC2_42_11]|nr:MAG: hypothetical protein A2073_04725 [Deltaproteobacteria bacterium GWC2_42_11]
MLKNIDRLDYIASDLLGSNAKITHAFLTRKGGVSAGVFSSLNFNLRDGDDYANVEYNKAKIGKLFGFDTLNLATVNQMHGSDIFIIDSINLLSKSKDIMADAITTNLSAVPIAVLTADCLPVLLYDRINKAIAVVHAGWKGTLNRVLQKSVMVMGKTWGTLPQHLAAALGPAIGRCCCNVDETVIVPFKQEFPDNNDFIFEAGKGWMFDLKKANYNQLAAIGLSEDNIWMDTHCTSCRQDLFFSYRRDNKKTGRHLNFMMLKEG